MVKFILVILLLLTNSSALPAKDVTFAKWLAGLKEEARLKGISESTITSTFKQAKFLPKVVVLDRSQPEFITTFSAYINKRVTRNRIAAGRLALKKHQALLVDVELHYGVPKAVLVAFWGLETNYGGHKGSYGLPSSLMTLAYEGRRPDFFRSQLMDVMRIIDAGHNTADSLRGSWAGAMGHMQFMPSTFLAYATDADADGQIGRASCRERV